MAVFCIRCGADNMDGAKFCRSCGSALPPASAEQGHGHVSEAPTTVMLPVESESPAAPVPPPAAPTVNRQPVAGDASSLRPQAPPTAPAGPYGQPAYPSGYPGYQQAPAHPPYQPPVRQAPAYESPRPPYQPPVQQPPFRQPSAYLPAGASYQPPAQVPYGQVAHYDLSTGQRGAAFFIGAGLVILCGILVLASSFMAWYGISGIIMRSGWETMQDMRDAGMNPFANFASIGADGDKLVFSGLCSLIIGALLVLAALLAMPMRSRGMAVLLLFFSLISLAMAGINTYSFLSLGEGIDLGAGMFLFLIGSAGGMVGSIVSLAG